MKHKFLGIYVLALVMVLGVSLVSADTECPTNSCPLNVTLNLGNSAPVITSVTAPANIVLNGGTNKIVYILFVADDANGNTDLNDSSAKVDMEDEAANIITSSGCTASVVNVSATEYNCTLSFPYYSRDDSWTVTASIADNAAATDTDNTQFSTVGALDFVTQDITTIAWATAAVGATDLASDAPMVITNGGNQAYATIAVTAYNATGGASTIPASDFGVSSTAAKYAALIEGTPVNSDATMTLAVNSTPYNVYFFVTLVPGLEATTYTQQNIWTVSVA